MRTAIITGGNGGLGSEVVSHFLNHSYQVLAIDIQPEMSASLKMCEQQVQLSYTPVNALNATEVAAFADTLAAADVLVNIIGGFDMGAFQETSLADLDKMLDLNLKSCFIMTQALLPMLLKSDSGRVINVGARPALQGGGQIIPYALSKAAVVNLTQSLAQEFQDSNLTFNAILPSTIDTPANRESMPDADSAKWVTPADLAHAIHFLAEPASRAINGALIPVYHKA